MSMHDYPFRARPVHEDFVMIARRARRMQSRVMATAIGGALRAITSFAVQRTRAVMQPVLRSRGGRSRPECGNAEGHDAAQWIWPTAPLVLPQAESQTITCDMGTIWITQGDTNDYVLTAGQSLALRPVDSVVVNAMSGPALVHRTHQQQIQPLVLKKEHAMSDLTLRERELVALGAAMGSNCVPCIEVHIPKARKAGLSDEQIAEAIQLADKVRQVPARKVLSVALRMLPPALAFSSDSSGSDDCSGASTTSGAGAACCA